MDTYERFAPLAPPRQREMQLDYQRLRNNARWQLRFLRLTHDDRRALELAKNRDVVLSLAAVTAGVGFVLGTLFATALWATHAQAQPKTPSVEGEAEQGPPPRKKRTGAKAKRAKREDGQG